MPAGRLYARESACRVATPAVGFMVCVAKRWLCLPPSAPTISTIEQGRRPASLGVLDALARGLHLDPDQRAYLFELAGKEDLHPRVAAPRRLRPALRRLLR